MARKDATSVLITVEIDHTAALSRAVATFLPVEMTFCVRSRFMLMSRRVSSATMADWLKLMLDMPVS